MSPWRDDALRCELGERVVAELLLVEDWMDLIDAWSWQKRECVLSSAHG
jgi:hypothetical protein